MANTKLINKMLLTTHTEEFLSNTYESVETILEELSISEIKNNYIAVELTESAVFLGVARTKELIVKAFNSLNTNNNFKLDLELMMTDNKYYLQYINDYRFYKVFLKIFSSLVISDIVSDPGYDSISSYFRQHLNIKLKTSVTSLQDSD